MFFLVAQFHFLPGTRKACVMPALWPWSCLLRFTDTKHTHHPSSRTVLPAHFHCSYPSVSQCPVRVPVSCSCKTPSQVCQDLCDGYPFFGTQYGSQVGTVGGRNMSTYHDGRMMARGLLYVRPLTDVVQCTEKHCELQAVRCTSVLGHQNLVFRCPL